MFETLKIIIALCSIALAAICIVYAKANKSYMISIIGLFVIVSSLIILFTSKTNVFASETTPKTETYYPALAVVTETNTETDSVTIMTLPDGNLWEFSGVEDLSGGDLAVCIFSNNGTPDYLQDDSIISIRYSGYVDGENSTSETGEKLLWFEFSSTYWDLTENY